MLAVEVFSLYCHAAVVVEHLVLEVVAEILADKLRVGHIFINFDDAAVFGVHAFTEQCAKDVDCFHFVLLIIKSFFLKNLPPLLPYSYI